MDYINKFTGGDKDKEGQQQQQQTASSSTEQKQGGGFLGGIGDKLNSAAGGGKESEKNEDMLDKGTLTTPTGAGENPRTNKTLGIDYVQEKFLGQGPQDNEVCYRQLPRRFAYASMC